MRRISVIVLMLGSVVIASRGQAPPAPPTPAQAPPAIAEVIGSGNFSPMVADLDKTIAFYHDVIGMTLSANESIRPLPWDTEVWHRDLHGLQGSPMRFATARFPGGRMGVEMVEQGSIERKPVLPRPQDPGAVTYILLVRDVDKMFAKVKQALAPVVTTGGAPIAVAAGASNSRAVIVKDPDGHYVEFLQLDPLPATAAPPDADLLGARLRITVADTDQTLRLYRDLFGLPFQAGPLIADTALTALMGLRGAQVRLSIAEIPQSNLQLEFLEVRGGDRRPVRSRIEDPGSTRFQLSVRNLETAIKLIKSAGPSTIVSNTGRILQDGTWEKGPLERPGVRWLTISDLNNIFLVLNDRPAAVQAPAGRGRANH